MRHRVRAQLPSGRQQLAQLTPGHHRAVAARADPGARVVDEADRHVDRGGNRVLAEDRQRDVMVVAHAIVERERREAGRRHAPGRLAGKLGQRHEAEARRKQQLDLRAEAIGGDQQHAEVIAPSRLGHAVVAEHYRPPAADLLERASGDRHLSSRGPARRRRSGQASA